MKSVFQKPFIKTASLMLAAAFPFAASGCGQNSGNGSSFEPKIWHEDSVDEIVMFCNDWEQFNGGAAVNSPVYKELRKKTGLTNTKLTAKSTSLENYYTLLDLQRVEGELCEMFIVDGPKSPEFFNNLIRDQEIIPISYYVNENTKDQYPNLYKYLKQFEYMKSNVSYANGELWFIPRKWSNDKSLYVRRDWIKNLNKKIDTILVSDGVVKSASEITDDLREQYKFSEEGPKNLAEFYALARAFTLYDPDNNGKNDTFGYVTEENRDMDSWIHVAYDSPWKMWVADESGTYKNTATSEGAMLATSLLNKMISEGYVSQEVGVKTVSAKHDDFVTNKAGMMYTHNWYNVICADMMQSIKVTMEKARENILCIDPPAGKNGTFGGQGDIRYYRGWCIKNGMSVERLNACLKLLEFLYSPEGVELVTYGVYREHWEWADAERTQKVTLCKPDRQGIVQELRWTDSAAFISYLTYITPESRALLTNGDILVERDKACEKTMILSDYPDLYTQSMMKNQSGAYGFFDETVMNMLINKGLKANWTYDAKTWKTDGMTKLYTVSSAMQSAWDDYVSAYYRTYKGAEMESEYNQAVKSGNYVKYSEN
ncbi:MAG TPA: hypothetical protein DDW54_00800 [Clostridiales bacterium]|nr:hypothetical protein [Clostridiales bacterium]